MRWFWRATACNDAATCDADVYFGGIRRKWIKLKRGYHLLERSMQVLRKGGRTQNIWQHHQVHQNDASNFGNMFQHVVEKMRCSIFAPCATIQILINKSVVIL